MSFSEWREVELEEVIELVIDYRGKTPKKLGGDWSQVGYRALSAKNIKTGRIVQEDAIRYLDSNLYTKWMKEKVNRGDILMTSEAPFGELLHWDSDEKIVLSQRLFCLRTNKKVDSKYLYYYMTTNRFQKELDARATGTTVRGLRQPQLLKCKIEYPPIKDQEAIANILSSMDEKIRVNNQINKTLENMAQAIFKQWFVDFEFPNEDGEPYKSSGGDMIESELGMIPKGWEVKVLGEIIDIIKQGTKPGEHLKDRKYNPIDTLPMKSIAINDFKPYEEAKSSLILFEKYDILIGAMRVYFHRVNLAPYKGITRTTTFVLRSKRIQDVPYNLFLLNMDETIDYAERTSKGSTMPYAVWDNGMSNILVAYSNQELRNKFFQIIQPMLETIMKKSAENEVLIKLRDSLLPKLMSGEIRVPLDEEGDVS